MEKSNNNSLTSELTSKPSQLNCNYYPIWNINKLSNYLQDFISIAKQHGYRGIVSKVREDLKNQITLTPFAIGLSEAQTSLIIKTVNNEAKELFIVSVQEFANLFLLLIRTILDTFERYRKPLELLKAKTGWTPPRNLLKRASAKVKKDFIQTQSSSVTMLYNAYRIVSFWFQYFHAFRKTETIWFSIFKLLSGALASRLYISLSSIHQNL